MRRFLKHMVLYSCFAFLVVNLFAFASLFSLKKSSFYKPSFVHTNFQDEELDYVILGSSTGLTTLNTNLIDEISGFKGANFSIDDTSMNTHYLMLKHLLAEGINTKTIVLVFSPNDIANKTPSISGNDYRFLPFSDRSYVHKYYSEIETPHIKKLTLSKYVPFLGVGFYNTEIVAPSLLALFNPEKRNRFDERGNYVYPDSGKSLKKSNTNKIKIIAKNPYYQKIEILCLQNNINLILYQPPTFKRNIKVENISNHLINHSNLISKTSFFYDEIHVNSKGRDEASKHFSEEFITIVNTLN